MQPPFFFIPLTISANYDIINRSVEGLYNV